MVEEVQEAEAAEETLVEYTRRLGLKVGEAYRWKQHLRRTGQWPAPEGAHGQEVAGTVEAAVRPGAGCGEDRGDVPFSASSGAAR